VWVNLKELKGWKTIYEFFVYLFCLFWFLFVCLFARLFVCFLGFFVCIEEQVLSLVIQECLLVVLMLFCMFVC